MKRELFPPCEQTFSPSVRNLNSRTNTSLIELLCLNQNGIGTDPDAARTEKIHNTSRPRLSEDVSSSHRFDGRIHDPFAGKLLKGFVREKEETELDIRSERVGQHA